MQDGSEFLIENVLQNEKDMPLKPHYLTWDNIKHPELIMESPSCWPYQIMSFDLISFAERFPRIAPPPESSSAVKKGFTLYRKYCRHCRTIKADGGGKGPDLAGITNRYTKTWLVDFISNLRSIRKKSTMAQLNPRLKDRNEIIK